jgi:hypothetical protein
VAREQCEGPQLGDGVLAYTLTLRPIRGKFSTPRGYAEKERKEASAGRSLASAR